MAIFGTLNLDDGILTPMVNRLGSTRCMLSLQADGDGGPDDDRQLSEGESKPESKSLRCVSLLNQGSWLNWQVLLVCTLN